MTAETAQEHRLGVLHIIDTLSTGGAERLLVTFAEVVDRDRFDLHVLPLQGPLDTSVGRDLRSLDIPIHSIGDIRLRDLHRFPALWRLLKTADIQVVHTHLPLSNTWGVTAAAAARRPVVSTIHNIQNDPQRFAQIKLVLEGFTLRHMAETVIACSPQVATFVSRQLRVPSTKTTILLNAINVDHLQHVSRSEADRVRQELLCGREGPLVVCVGSLHARKGHHILVQAVPGLLQRFPEAIVALVGRGTEHEPALRTAIREANLDRSVHPIGERQDIATVFAACDLVVLPSLVEGLPLTLLEAMAAARPVVATAVGGVPEAMENDVQGLLVPPADPGALAHAMCAVLEQPSMGTHMGEEGRRTVRERFGSDIWARRLEDIYRAASGSTR